MLTNNDFSSMELVNTLITNNNNMEIITLLENIKVHLESYSFERALDVLNEYQNTV